MKKYVPNSKLPKGATLLRKVSTKKIGGWSESLKYDATVKRHGLTWYRVQGGFGDGTYSHEDWVADIPSGTLSVSNSDWDGSHPFGYDESRPLHASFNKAVIGAMKKHLPKGNRRVEELRQQLARAERAQKMVAASFVAATSKITQ